MERRYVGPTGPLVHRCAQCLSTGPRLIRCTQCQAVRYCNLEHQADHLPQHEHVCSGIKKSRDELAEGLREAQLSAPLSSSSYDSDMNPCTNLREKLAVARLFPIGTLDSLQEALDQLKIVLGSGGGDKLWGNISTMMLRLDLDQECYDFVKWAETGVSALRHDSHNSLPYFGLGADVHEDPEFFSNDVRSRNQVVDANVLENSDSPKTRGRPRSHEGVVLLLKLKILVDIRNIKITRRIVASARLPFDIQSMIEKAVIRSPISVKLQKESFQTLSTIVRKLVSQICTLGRSLHSDNDCNFISQILQARPAAPTFRFEDENYRVSIFAMFSSQWVSSPAVLKHLSIAFWETEGVLDLLANSIFYSVGDIKYWESSNYSRLLEIQQGVMGQRIWDNLPYVVEKSSCLGPGAERPSEGRKRKRE